MHVPMLPDEVYAMKCPRCAHVMNKLIHVDHPLERCEECGGVWLTTAAATTVSSTLDDYVQRVADVTERDAHLPFADRGDTPPIACPECQRTCERRTIGGVEIDRCADHGTWYDAGEIQRVAAYLTALDEGAKIARETDAQDDAALIDEAESESPATSLPTPDGSVLSMMLSSAGYSTLGRLFNDD